MQEIVAETRLHRTPYIQQYNVATPKSIVANDYKMEVITSDMRGHGRPPLDICEDQVRFLVENGFEGIEIAALIGCSTHTIQIKLKEFGIEFNRFSDITNGRFR